MSNTDVEKPSSQRAPAAAEPAKPPPMIATELPTCIPYPLCIRQMNCRDIGWQDNSSLWAERKVAEHRALACIQRLIAAIPLSWRAGRCILIAVDQCRIHAATMRRPTLVQGPWTCPTPPAASTSCCLPIPGEGHFRCAHYKRIVIAVSACESRSSAPGFRFAIFTKRVPHGRA